MSDVMTTAEAYRTYGRAKTPTQLRNGRWQRPARGVIVTHNGPLDERANHALVLAASQSRAALGGLTALAYDGFAGFAPPAVQLILPDGARAPSVPELEPHWSLFLDDRDVHPLAQPRRTRVARSVVDAASWSINGRYARAIVIAAVQQRLTTTRHLREALTRRGKCRHRALIVQSILDAAGGIQSLPERDMQSIVTGLGWRPTHQRPVRGKDGRFFLDVHIGQLDLSIEVHGIPHLAVRRWDQDLFRANEIVIAGANLMIFCSYAIRHERRAVIDQLRRFEARRAA